jgi:ribonuclease P protein component
MAFVRGWPPLAGVGCWPRDARRAASASLLDPRFLTAPGSLSLAAAPLDEAAPQSRGFGLPVSEVSAASGLVRLKTRADFLRVAAGRRRAVRPGLVLQAAPHPLGTTGAEAVRVGFTASRKVGNAVVRNRAKRRLRAAAAAVLGRAGRPGTDYVLIARGGTGGRPYAELVGDLATALRQIDRQMGRPVDRPVDRRAANPDHGAARRFDGRSG